MNVSLAPGSPSLHVCAASVGVSETRIGLHVCLQCLSVHPSVRPSVRGLWLGQVNVASLSRLLRGCGSPRGLKPGTEGWAQGGLEAQLKNFPGRGGSSWREKGELSESTAPT